MSLVNMAVGDAWGVPFEMMMQHDPILKQWDGKTLPTGNLFHDCTDGQYSDDTQRAKCLAESLVTRHGYDRDDAASHYFRWYKSGTARGMGGSIRQAMEAIDRGVALDRCGVPGAKGNGTAMRALPLGIYFRRTPEFIGPASVLDAHITHVRDEAVDGTYVVAMLAAVALGPGNDPRPLTVNDVKWVANTLPKGTRLIQNALYRACLASVDTSGPLAEMRSIKAELEGGVVETIGTAVHALLVGRDFHHVLELCIRCGGDTDTRAAIACGLRGFAEPAPDWLRAPVQELDELILLDKQLLKG